MAVQRQRSNSFSRNASADRQLVLNFAPIHFEDAEIIVGVAPYKDRDYLRSLRQQYSDTHLFHREKNQILSVAIAPEAEVIGETSETIKLSDNLYLCASLVRNALINFLDGLDRRILEYNPIEFVANSAKDNLLAKILPPFGLEAPDWLSVCPRYIAAIRTVSFDQQPMSLGLALNARTKRWIELPCSTLIEKGISPIGFYVSQWVELSDRRMAPYPKLLGQVQSIAGNVLTLTDARSDITSVQANEVFLEPRREAFNYCLDQLFREQATDIKESLDEELAAFRNGSNRLRRLRSVVQYLSNQSLELLPGVPFTTQAFLAESSDNFPAIHNAPAATYVFAPTGEKTARWNDGGLSEYGPYTAQTFTPSTPRICIICQRTRKGQVEQFLYKFLNGVTVSELNKGGSPKRQPFAKGFVHKYALENVETKFFLVDDNTAAAYDRAVRQALAHQTKEGFRWNLAFVQTDEAFHNLYGDENPYLTTKAAFLAEQIPVQEFEIETIDAPDRSLCYVLNIMALATYAKLGGIPWLIKANPTIAHELVFGLGSAFIGQGRLGQRERVVGITTVFSGDGNYRLSNLSQAVPVADYQDALLESLQDTISKVKRSMNWQPKDHVRLIFHAFKPLKNAEAEAVKKLMDELGDYDVDYAFIHVVEDHPFMLFDEAQQGVWDYETRTNNKGMFAPTRGLFLRLSRSEVLMSLTGAKEVKRPQDGIPSPLLLRLHRQSTFDDTTYLARQVYTFSCHSWRSFFPAPMPVTILYSELIARMLGQLGTVSRWNPNAMLGRIGETRWFL